MPTLAVDLSFLPAVNASLNGLATVMLMLGLVLIKQKKIEAHRNVMLAAFSLSILFLITYVTHYIWRASQTEGELHTRYNAEGLLLTFYYGMLISHILLAMVVPFFAVALIWLGWTKRYDTHRKVAKIGWPIWMYVSITGVMIYVMLYHLNPPLGG